MAYIGADKENPVDYEILKARYYSSLEKIEILSREVEELQSTVSSLSRDVDDLWGNQVELERCYEEFKTSGLILLMITLILGVTL